MDRILYKEADGDLTCRARDFDKVFPTLYAYEETGLTPDQAKALNANLDAMTALAQDLSDQLAQVKKELTSYKDLGLTAEEIEQQFKNFSSFLMEMTGGRMSKTNYTVQAMVSEANDHFESVCDECSDRQGLAEIEKELQQLKELWDVLPAHIQAKAREVRDLNKVQELFAEDTNVPGKADNEEE